MLNNSSMLPPDREAVFEETGLTRAYGLCLCGLTAGDAHAERAVMFKKFVGSAGRIHDSRLAFRITGILSLPIMTRKNSDFYMLNNSGMFSRASANLWPGRGLRGHRAQEGGYEMREDLFL